jgi:hypothetical protein
MDAAHPDSGEEVDPGSGMIIGVASSIDESQGYYTWQLCRGGFRLFLPDFLESWIEVIFASPFWIRSIHGSFSGGEFRWNYDVVDEEARLVLMHTGLAQVHFCCVLRLSMVELAEKLASDGLWSRTQV